MNNDEQLYATQGARVLQIDPDVNMGKVFDDYQASMDMASSRMKDVTAFWDEGYDRLQSEEALQGEPMPWSKTASNFRFRPGELTIWAGVNKNGKSLVVGQCAAWFDRPVVIASLEMKPVETVARVMRQVTGLRRPSRRFYDERIMELHNSFYIYDKLGRATPKEMYGLIHYAAVEKGCGHVVIDSLVKLGVSGDNEKQTEVANMLQEMAKDHNVHVHLIHHMRKGMHEEEIPDKFSVKGAGELVDLCDNLIIVHKNVKKERLRDCNSDDYDESDPDGFLRIAANRHGEWTGTFKFWFHEDSLQWIPRYNAGPMPWPHPGE